MQSLKKIDVSTPFYKHFYTLSKMIAPHIVESHAAVSGLQCLNFRRNKDF